MEEREIGTILLGHSKTAVVVLTSNSGRMRKQSTVLVMEPKQRVVKSNLEVSKESAISFFDGSDLGLEVVSAPNPLDKPILRKVSTLLPASEMKNLFGIENLSKKLPRNTTSAFLAEKAKSSQQTNPFVGMKQSALKANQLVDAILTEDHRWVDVPDPYQDYKATDFVMKLDSTKLEVSAFSIWCD